MNRRSLFKAAAGLAVTPASMSSITPISDASKRQEENAFIIGAYMILTPDKRAKAREKLRDLGEHALADAFAKLAA
jgi:hypothetical protein